MYVQYGYPTVPVTLIVRNTIFSARGADSPIFIAGYVDLKIDDLFYMPNSAYVLENGDETYD